MPCRRVPSSSQTPPPPACPWPSGPGPRGAAGGSGTASTIFIIIHFYFPPYTICKVLKCDLHYHDYNYVTALLFFYACLVQVVAVDEGLHDVVPLVEDHGHQPEGFLYNSRA